MQQEEVTGGAEAFAAVQQRGSIDYMLRTTQQHHVQLSAMADQKANILIGASSIMLTIIVGQFHDHAISPALVVLGLFILVAAVFAIIAVMPALRRVESTGNGFNPLFFGHFISLDEPEYARRMASILEDDGRVYECITRDIYQIGQVLYRRKYRFLTYSYRTFLAGLILSALVLVLQQLLQVFGG